jgi:ketosteroid isomerase-like protein
MITPALLPARSLDEPENTMTSPDANVIAAFFAAINRHDVAAVAELMSEDHTFIDSWGRTVSGRIEMVAAWKAYFSMFPDYEILMDTVLAENSIVAIFGSASGTYNGKRGLVSENRIAMPAAWKASVANGKVRLWQVYCDWTEGMRTIEEDKKAASFKQSAPQTPSSDTQAAGAPGAPSL